MLPPVPDGADPAEHRYEQIQFRQCTVPLNPEYPIKGNWTIQDNWDHRAACLQHPLNDWMKYPCFKFFDLTEFAALAPVMKVAEEGDSPKQLANDCSKEATEGIAKGLPAILDGDAASSSSKRSDEAVQASGASLSASLAQSSSNGTPEKPKDSDSPEYRCPSSVSIPGLKPAPPKGKPRSAELVNSVLAKVWAAYDPEEVEEPRD
eukprot:5081888-Heterocapsa_arctica.AAC.1